MDITKAKSELRKLLIDYKYINSLKEEISSIMFEVIGLSDRMKDCPPEIKDVLKARYKNLSLEINTKETAIFGIEQKNRKRVQLINSLEQPQRMILYSHYVLGETYEDIAYKLNYSLSRIFQFHRNAVENYSEQINNQEGDELSK